MRKIIYHNHTTPIIHNHTTPTIFTLNSIQIAQQAIELILDQFVKQLKSKAAMLKVPKYSSQYFENIIYAMINTQIFVIPELSLTTTDDEPKSLISDLMMSGCVGINYSQSLNTKQQIQQPKQEKIQIKKQEKKKNLKWNQTECIRIPIEPQNQQDRMIRFLRQKWILDNSNKKKQIQIVKKNRVNYLSIKEISMQTFDYDGKIIRLKEKRSNNLVKQKLEFDIKKQQIMIKSNKKLKTNKVIGQEQINNSKIQQQQQISIHSIPKSEIKQLNQTIFQEYQNPIPNIQPAQGVKFITTKKIEQKFHKNKFLSIHEIKGKMKQMKLTRNQYQSIKKSEAENFLQHTMTMKIQNHNRVHQKGLKTVISTLPTLDDQLLTKKYRSIELTRKNSSKIKVDNHELKERYLFQQDEQMMDSQIKLIKSNSLDKKMNENKSQLKIDTHLDFLMNRSKSKTLINKPLVLPQIKRKNSSNLSIKIREKLKNEHQLLFQVRKRFNDKLRQSSYQN